jgi:hypothetical protein
MIRNETERQEAVAKLREMLKPGDKVYTILRHVARSRMTRHVSAVIIHEGKPFEISYLVARCLDYRRNRDDGGLVVGGCNMDMGFEIVYNLGRKLFPKGFKPSEAGRQGRNGSDDKAVDKDGGYSLNHEWL